MIAYDTTIDLFVDRLEKHSSKMTSWFFEKFMKLNEEKGYFMLYGERLDRPNVNVDPAMIKESIEEKFLGLLLIEDSLLKPMLNSLYVKPILLQNLQNLLITYHSYY